jgi:hypothetical protein
VAILVVALPALVSGCGDDSAEVASETLPGPRERSRDLSTFSRSSARGQETVAAARCRPEVPDCRTTRGRITYVERVDPDGDGDAHFVIVDPQGITLPGLTVIDVRKGLRPDPLPGPGDLISAAGPVQEGSYGQSQIHALELHVARAQVNRRRSR